MVNRHGGGAALLDRPDVLEKVVRAVRNAVSDSMMVSAKMRLGVEDDRCAEDCARAIEAGGAGQLVVHARTKAEGYRPPAHWQRIRDIRRVVGIRVIANGEIWSVEDALRCREESGCTDLMLGRGMVANPGLAREIREAGVMSANVGGAAPPVQSLRWAEVVPSLVELWMSRAGEASVPARAGRLKQWLVFLRRKFAEAAQIFERIRASNDADFISSMIVSAEGR
jgi:tRNA-dihydrouridine synthase C